ncbi:MAG: hypothetical protein GY756_09865 [bacterium]|nr:hypothetical protein [bacterium]
MNYKPFKCPKCNKIAMYYNESFVYGKVIRSEDFLIVGINGELLQPSPQEKYKKCAFCKRSIMKDFIVSIKKEKDYQNEDDRY